MDEDKHVASVDTRKFFHTASAWIAVNGSWRNATTAMRAADDSSNKKTPRDSGGNNEQLGAVNLDLTDRGNEEVSGGSPVAGNAGKGGSSANTGGSGGGGADTTMDDDPERGMPLKFFRINMHMLNTACRMFVNLTPSQARTYYLHKIRPRHRRSCTLVEAGCYHRGGAGAAADDDDEPLVKAQYRELRTRKMTASGESAELRTMLLKQKMFEKVKDTEDENVHPEIAKWVATAEKRAQRSSDVSTTDQDPDVEHEDDEEGDPDENDAVDDDAVEELNDDPSTSTAIKKRRRSSSRKNGGSKMNPDWNQSWKSFNPMAPTPTLKRSKKKRIE
uniref:Uncharacterized protein n=1 Tax=Globodera rostochiensis TaxID=31243 RepID=A0A914IHJ8_GLORO